MVLHCNHHLSIQNISEKRLFKANLWKLHRNSPATFERINIFSWLRNSCSSNWVVGHFPVKLAVSGSDIYSALLGLALFICLLNLDLGRFCQSKCLTDSKWFRMLQTYLVVALVNLFALLKNYLCEVEYVQNGKQNETNTASHCKQELVVGLVLLQMSWWAGQNSPWNWRGLVYFFQKNCYAKLLLSSIIVLFWFPHSWGNCQKKYCNLFDTFTWQFSG